MTSCRQIRRAGMVLLLVAGMAMPGCGAIKNIEGLGEITPTRAISDVVLPAAEAAELGDEHFVTNWLLLGPFTFKAEDFGGEQQQAAAASEFMPDEDGLNGTQDAPKGTAWKEQKFTDPSSTGCVDFDVVYPDTEHAAAYAVAWLSASEDISDAKLLIGSDDYIIVWINGKKVHTYADQRRAAQADQDSAAGISLKKGTNRIVVKCVDVVYGWQFFLRLTDKDGKPIAVKARPAPAAPAPE